ncbi:probable serine/threonine protein kinase IRE4 isoform X1 [Varroa jacobsoni]|uniref:probable serine/threonine protein kinase IRE4 isoform X1 n=1 Tax=Varroa jacobsoni TaxID=62625 RepID=UPI000BF778F4|nr:probable serine/threonine protein kinase IRE4 isoform X1 [Varroa jacobsoni]
MEFSFQLLPLPYLRLLRGVICRDQGELRICQGLLEVLYKHERTVREEWSPCRVFGGLQVANVAYETGSRILNNVLQYDVLVESIRNLVEFINLFTSLNAFDVTVEISVQVKNFIEALSGVANSIEIANGLSRFPWEVIAEELVMKARSRSSDEPQLNTFTIDDIPKLEDITRVRFLRRDPGSSCKRYAGLRASTDEKLLIRLKQRNVKYSEEKAIASVMFGMPCVEYVSFFCTQQAHVFLQRGPEGPLLSDLFSPKSKFRCSELLEAVNALVNAVSALHALGVIHRDVRPDSVYYHNNNIRFANVEHARVCIGNYIRNKEWISTFFVRTSMEFYTEDYNRWSLLSRREFQAPEILSGRAYGRAVDWWAVGVSLFKMACGHLPFREGNESTILRQRILSDEVKWEPRFRRRKTQFRDFVLGLLMKDPTQRLGSKDYREILYHKVFKLRKSKSRNLRKSKKEDYKPFDEQASVRSEKETRLRELKEVGSLVMVPRETFVSLQWRGQSVEALTMVKSAKLGSKTVHSLDSRLSTSSKSTLKKRPKELAGRTI